MTKLNKSVLASPAKLRAIADRLERETREAVAELRRLADLGEGTAKVKARTAAKPKKAKKAKKRVTAKRVKRATAAKKRPAPKKTTKAAAPKVAKAAAVKKAKAPLANGHDHQAAAR